MGLFEILKGEQPGLMKSLLHYKNVEGSMVSILQSMPCLAAAWKDITLY